MKTRFICLILLCGISHATHGKDTRICENEDILMVGNDSTETLLAMNKVIGGNRGIAQSPPTPGMNIWGLCNHIDTHIRDSDKMKEYFIWYAKATNATDKDKAVGEYLSKNPKSHVCDDDEHILFSTIVKQYQIGFSLIVNDFGIDLLAHDLGKNIVAQLEAYKDDEAQGDDEYIEDINRYIKRIKQLMEQQKKARSPQGTTTT